VAAAVLAVTALLSVQGASGAGTQRAARASGTLVWSDEFSGAAGKPPDPSKWAYDIGGGGWGNNELESYTRSTRNAHLDGNGHLVIAARHEDHTGPDGHRRHYTSARLKTLGRFSFRYGKVAARMRVPAGRGLWPAFWMLGADINRVGYPNCGEIDVMELLGQQPRKVYGTVHGPGPDLDTGIGGSLRAKRSLARGFHTYAARWTPRSVRFSLDGHVYEVVRKRDYPNGDKWALDHRMFMLLNLAVGGSWPGAPDAATDFPARLKVDWVRVWSAG
jgi:beta-glucanase (GH16 family)